MEGPALPTLLERLAIFPLPAVQLFPHTLLPLHVFEPRYRALTRDALAGSRLVGVPMLEPGYEDDYGGRPAVRPICGVGQIVQSHLHPDGRYDILLHGLGRVRIVEELPPSQPYRVVRALRVDDEPEEAGMLAEHRALLALCDRLAVALPSGGSTLRELSRQESSPGAACDVVASALLTEPTDRQRVLETLEPRARIERLNESLARLLSSFVSAGRPRSERPN
jgi:Lon protease-like protein